MENVTIVDIAPYLSDPESAEAKAAVAQIVDSFRATSCLAIRDPRVTFDDNEKFLNMMEQYFNLPFDQKLNDTRPQWHYQVGATPEKTEVPRDHTKKIEQLGEQSKPHVPKGPDAKWRFFWRAGERPKSTEFTDLNMPQVVPEGFPQWEQTMNQWAQFMLQSSSTVAEMLAVGLGLDKDTFTSRMKGAPHLLAPTGSDVQKYGTVGEILAGFHYDLNFMTIHGKSRYPGLYIWLRDGTKIPVRIPDGCLLLQAGKQLEYLTGGYLEAGFHEVVVTEDTLKAVEKAKQLGRPLWRVSSTLFSHIASDVVLEPLKPEWKEASSGKYPPVKTGEQVLNELRSINLAKG